MHVNNHYCLHNLQLQINCRVPKSVVFQKLAEPKNLKNSQRSIETPHPAEYIVHVRQILSSSKEKGGCMTRRRFVKMRLNILWSPESYNGQHLMEDTTHQVT